MGQVYDSVVFERPLKHYTHEEILETFPDKFVFIENPDRRLDITSGGYVLAAVDPRDLDKRYEAQCACDPDGFTMEISTVSLGWRVECMLSQNEEYIMEKSEGSVVFKRPLKHYTHDEILTLFPDKFVFIENPDVPYDLRSGGYVLAAVDYNDDAKHLEALRARDPEILTMEISTVTNDCGLYIY